MTNGLQRPRAGQEGKGGSAGSASASSVALCPAVPGGGAAAGRPEGSPSTAAPLGAAPSREQLWLGRITPQAPNCVPNQAQSRTIATLGHMLAPQKGGS